MTIRGVIFDLDGTLGDTLPVCYEAFRRVFADRLGRTFSDDEIHAMFGPSEEGILQKLFPREPQAALEHYLIEYGRAHVACPRPFAGIPQVLDLLKSRGVDVAIVTGKGPHSAKISLERMGLDAFFETVEAGSPHGGVKAAGMRRILKRWKRSAREVVGVGDHPSDIRDARKVGLHSVAAAWAPTVDSAALAQQHPHQLLASVAALDAWLRNVVPPSQH